METPELAFPLLHTKLFRPPLADGLVMRPRLLAELERGVSRPLILVTAPAGYGKTTLVNSWLAATSHHHAWLSLDEHDAELADFVAYLITAVERAFPELGQSAASALAAPALPPPARLADLFLRDLRELSHPLVVVLDDYHAALSQDVRAFMGRVIQHMPADLHVVVTTRADPILPLGRLRGLRQITEIRTADLRFTADETSELVRRLAGENLPDELVGLLAERTEGWPVGLQLAAISLRDSGDSEAFARRFAQSNHRLLMDYLLSEVLETLPEAQRAMVLYSAIFERFCAPLCALVAGAAATPGTGAAFIAGLREANLFLVALDEQGTWYRYHHLFRDLLRHQLRQAMPPEAIAGLHRAASLWFENEGLIEEAIVHAIEGHDDLRAAQLVEATWHEALNQEDWRRLERWLALLPEPMLQRPALLVCQAFLQHFRFKVSAIGPLIDAAERGLVEDVGGYTAAQRQALHGAINTLRANAIGFLPGKPEAIVTLSELALQQLSPEMAFARSLAEFWQIYGLQHCGQSEAAMALAHQWLRQQPEQPDVRALRQLLALCGIYYDGADIPALMATATTFREVAVRAQRGLSLGWANFLLGWAHYQSNELATAAEYFEQVAGSPFGAHGRTVIDSLVGLALARHAQGQEKGARAAVGSLRAYLLDSGTVDLMPVAASLAVRLASGHGPWDTPSGFARGLDAQLAGDIWELPGLTAVRGSILAAEPARLVAAAELLAQCRLLAESRHTKRRLIEIAILEASLRAAQGDDAATLAALQQAVALGEPGGGLRFFLDEGPGLRPYLQQLLDQDVAPAYVRAILAAYPAQSAVPPSPAYSLQVVGRDTAREPYPDDLLTNREIDVLLLLEQRLTNKEIATRLSISPRTVQKHAINIYQKLHVNNRRQAAARARALGLLPQASEHPPSSLAPTFRLRAARSSH